MIYYNYTKISEPGPNGTTITARLPEADGQRIGNELATINGVTYLSLPDDVVMPEQPAAITLTPVVLTDALRAELKLINPICRLIDQQIRAKIRERYDAEDEMYLTRISVGALMGAYVFQPGEQEAVAEYGAYVEGVRAWARDERAKVGL
jgi:hypothetical protein